MMAPPDLDHVAYRVFVLDPVSRTVLVHADRRTPRVLRVFISPEARTAKELCAELRRAWDIEVLILDCLPSSRASGVCVVAELLQKKVPAHLSAIRVEEIANDEVSDAEREQLLGVLKDEVTSPFSRIGWTEEAVCWAESVTGQRLRAVAGIEQYNAGGAFTLLRLSMQGGHSYWLKATGTSNMHERALTRTLATLCPRSLPHIVAEKPEWNAWLTAGSACSLTSLPMCEIHLVQLMARAVRALAELQLGTVGAEALLFNAGAFDQRLEALRAGADELFTYLDEAMSFQSSTRVPRVKAQRFKEIREILNRVLDHIDRLRISSTILHGDMNLGNLVFTDESCQIIDWCEGYIGFPLATFQHLLLLNPVEDPTAKAAVEHTLKGIYQSAMRPICDPLQMREGLTCMALFAAFSALFGRGEWLRSELRNDPRRYGYARCIARHMDRAASDSSLLQMLCV